MHLNPTMCVEMLQNGEYGSIKAQIQKCKAEKMEFNLLKYQ